MELYKDYGFFKAFKHDTDETLVQLEEFKMLGNFGEFRKTYNAYKGFMLDIKTDGYDGWIGAVKHDNEKLHRIMFRIGAIPYRLTDTSTVYYKGVWK